MVEAVTIILAIGSVASPIIYGYVLWKMSEVFVSKTEFQDFKTTVEKKENATGETLKEINKNMIELLQRTAHLRSE